MKFEVYDGNAKVNDLSVSEVWDEPSEKVMHQVVVSRLANKRSGNANTKTRSEVRGGGKKPWKQKGLGRARAGTRNSPLWRGGGITFGPKARDFSMKINKKQKSRAYIYAISKLYELGKLKVVPGMDVESHKTKDFLKALSGVVEDVKNGRIVVVTDSYEKNMLIGSRNLPNVTVLSVDAIDILPLVYANQVVVYESAMKKLDERFQNILS